MQTIGFAEFKTQYTHLINQLVRTGEPLMIVRAGKPVAQLQPVSKQQTKKPKTLRGALKGWVTLKDGGGLDKPLSCAEDWSAINGEENHLYESAARHTRPAVARRRSPKARKKSS